MAPTRSRSTSRPHATTGFRVGDTVDVLSAGPHRTFDVVGFFALGDGGDTGPLRSPPSTCPRHKGHGRAAGRLDAVYVTGEPGVTPAALRASRSRAALGPGYEVSDPDQVAADSGNQDISEFLDLLTGVLLGFAALGLVVGAFIIFNTFTILVTSAPTSSGCCARWAPRADRSITSVVVEARGRRQRSRPSPGLRSVCVLARLLFVAGRLARLRIPSGDLVVEPRTVVARGRGGHWW